MTSAPAITVRYFAAARDLAGTSSELVALPAASVEQSALRDLLIRAHPRLGPHAARMRFAINGELHPGSATVHAGDEVDVLPPVAGGAEVTLCRIDERPLSVDEALAAVRHPSAGGVALFAGVVRDHAEGKPVARLDYEAHPTLADREMRRVLEEVAAELPGVRLAAVHRVGSLIIGDLAVVVAASAAHRAEAFDACRRAIDRIKETVPVWKHEWDAAGEANWVNLEEG